MVSRLGSCPALGKHYMMVMRGFEMIAARMLARQGMGVIWDLHVRAAASYRQGNWLSATALVGLADTAERLWRNG